MDTLWEVVPARTTSAPVWCACVIGGEEAYAGERERERECVCVCVCVLAGGEMCLVLLEIISVDSKDGIGTHR